MFNLNHLHEEIMAKLRTTSTVDLSKLPSAHERENLQTKLDGIFDESYGQLSSELRGRMRSEFFSAGPIEALLLRADVSEIIVNGPNVIWFEARGQLHHHDDHFLSAISFQNFIHRLMAEARMQANLDRPFADGYWRHFRVHLIIPPLAQNGAHLTLRRHPENPWTLSRLEEVGWGSPEALTRIKKIVDDRQSLLIVGATGSGKTSVLNACLQNISPRERAVIIEDTNEIHLPNPVSVKLISRQDPQGVLKDVEQSDLIKQSLRMRPDRLIMGEVRGAEAKDLLMALSTGHSGGLATLHADNPRQALFRLEMLVQMGAPQWSLRAIRHLIYFGLQYILSAKKIHGVRKMDSLYRIVSLEETGFCLERVI